MAETLLQSDKKLDPVASDPCAGVTPTRNPLQVGLSDGLVLAGLLLLTALYGLWLVRSALFVHEDAAMLLRYAENLAHGHGIVWNVGERPVDGATDFLYMLLLAGLAKAGLSVEFAARMVGALAHFLTVIAVYCANRFVQRSGRLTAATLAGYLALGPGLWYAAVGFGTPLFALLVCIAWYVALQIQRGRSSRGTCLAFSIAGLLAGLCRPEGGFYTFFMLLALSYTEEWRVFRRIGLYCATVFAALGGAYFFWHWRRFGYPLPNPYYMKGGGHLYWGSLVLSVDRTVLFAGPFLALLFLGLGFRKSTRLAVFSLIPVIGFTGLWVLLSSAQNYLGRFQYACLPVVLCTAGPLFHAICGELGLPGLRSLDRRGRAAVFAFGLTIWLAVLAVQYRTFRKEYSVQSVLSRNLQNVATLLRKYADQNRTIATTEAGIMPFYSKWRAVDALGLNDTWISHHGMITEAYLDQYRPHVIMFHALFSPLTLDSHRSAASMGGFWSSTVAVLLDYAEKHNYSLAAVYGETPFDTIYYFVRPDLSASTEIVRTIQGVQLIPYEERNGVLNYAALKGTTDGRSASGFARRAR
jgi:hypothetical protein